MAVCDVVVVGSYPPAPGPATTAPLTAVRRAWDAGSTVRVVSYRPGASDQVVPVAGPLAGRRLEQVRRHYQEPRRLVLVLQDGAPFADRSLAAQVLTAAGLLWAFRRFGAAELVFGEDPGLLRPVVQLLVKAASRVSVASPDLGAALCTRYKLPVSCVAVDPAEAYPMVRADIDPSTWGLFRPGAQASLAIVEMPTTTVAERLRARAVASKSLVARRLRGH